MIDNIMEKLIEGNNQYQWKIKQDLESIETKGKGPKYPVLFLTCMDSRIDIHRIFQLSPGDVLVLRNAGNIYTKDTLRSALIAVYEYNVRFIIILGHLDCGMKKVNLMKLKDKLNITTLKMIMSQGTNVFLEFQKFFKTFVDEIKNIMYQVEKFQETKFFPANVKIIGMLYDPSTGWVLQDSEFSRYSIYENFMRDYKKIIENKKFKLIDYITSIESEIIGIQENKPAAKAWKAEDSSELKSSPDTVKITSQENIKVDTNQYVALQTILEKNSEMIEKTIKMVSKVQTPKIYVPKVKIYIPKIDKYKNDKSE
ncbi:MAG: carbonic anhydrase [Candidatus Lokiarchaeota archaeon]|nr:carbonic anhydrase [Candidatus Lokiarchaeota archaeon]